MKRSFQLFVLKSSLNYGCNRTKEMLVKSAASIYGVPKSSLSQDNILRTSKGKPYFENTQVHFSISHTHDLWCCFFAPTNCGIDMEYIRPCNFEKIAGRFFSENERRYIQKESLKGFFEVWTAREAYGKYTGKGFFGEMPEFVSEEGKLNEVITVADGDQRKIRLERLFIADDVVCTVCTQDKGQEPIVVTKQWEYKDYFSFE